jgi:hypothetical protein
MLCFEQNERVVPIIDGMNHIYVLDGMNHIYKLLRTVDSFYCH